jgi:hypothetical protein
MTTTLIDAEQRAPGLPADLRQQLGERALIDLALGAVQTVGEGLPRPLAAAGRHSPQMLLTLLTYCYAAGVYGSEDIEYDCRNDAATRYLSANASPDQNAIRNFRRANRQSIEACLACVYGRAHGVTSAQTSGEPSLASSRALFDFARRQVELAIMIDMAMHD